MRARVSPACRKTTEHRLLRCVPTRILRVPRLRSNRVSNAGHRETHVNPSFALPKCLGFFIREYILSRIANVPSYLMYLKKGRWKQINIMKKKSKKKQKVNKRCIEKYFSTGRWSETLCWWKMFRNIKSKEFITILVFIYLLLLIFSFRIEFTFHISFHVYFFLYKLKFLFLFTWIY